MKVQLAVFDMAGTTVRDDDHVGRCLRDALAARGVNATRSQVNRVMGIPKPDAIRSLLRLLSPGASHHLEENTAAIHKDFLNRMIAHYRQSTTVEPMPHTVDTFRQLRAAGIRVVLDTGFSRPIVNAILDRLGWTGSDVLDATVASDEVPRGRPHPDLIFRAMELTGVRDAGAVAKIGDTPSDLMEGQAAGCRFVIGVTNGTHSAPELQPHPHSHLISSLAELPGILLQASTP